MSQIVIRNKSGEVVRSIPVPANGLTVRELAQHLREQRGGVRPKPHHVVTVEAGPAPQGPKDPAAELARLMGPPPRAVAPKARSCGS